MRGVRRELLLAPLGVFAILLTSGFLRTHADAGWDLRVVCNAVSALRRGADPYLVSNLGGKLSFPYLPFLAWLSAPVCLVSPAGSLVYTWLFLALLAGSIAALARGLGSTWLEAALMGFAAPAMFDVGPQVILTGNPAIIEVPLMAAAILAWHRGRPVLAAAFLGAMASIKILPVIDLMVFPFLLPFWRQSARAVAAGLASFLTIIGANLAFMGALRGSFLRQLVGGIPDQHSAFGELRGGSSDPNLPDFIFRLADAIGLSHPTLPITVIALLFLTLGAVLIELRGASAEQDAPILRTRLFCLTLLAINLALFRLKPYAFAALVPLAVGACMGEEGRVRIGVFSAVVLSVVPARLLGFLPGVGHVILAYVQMVSLLISGGVLLMCATLKKQAVLF